MEGLRLFWHARGRNRWLALLLCWRFGISLRSPTVQQPATSPAGFLIGGMCCVLLAAHLLLRASSMLTKVAVRAWRRRRAIATVAALLTTATALGALVGLTLHAAWRPQELQINAVIIIDGVIPGMDHHPWIMASPITTAVARTVPPAALLKEFDHTLGFPGEGPGVAANLAAGRACGHAACHLFGTLTPGPNSPDRCRGCAMPMGGNSPRQEDGDTPMTTGRGSAGLQQVVVRNTFVEIADVAASHPRTLRRNRTDGDTPLPTASEAPLPQAGPRQQLPAGPPQVASLSLGENMDSGSQPNASASAPRGQGHRRRSRSRSDPQHATDSRAHCPVTGCSCSAGQRHRGWTRVENMMPHINAHLSGQLAGEVPARWLSDNRKGRCRVCGLCVAAFRGIHPTCRPQERRASQQSGQQPTAPQTQPQDLADLPSLEEVHSRRVPTYRHVPKHCRGKWGQVVIRCLALVIHTNSAAAWTELEMLPKSVLCTPPRQGKKHDKATAAFTLDRIARWEAGERLSLWQDLPVQKRNKADISREAKVRRAEALVREGLNGKACAALVAEPLVEPTRDSLRLVSQLHPSESEPPRRNINDLALAPRLSSDAVLEALRSFPKGTGAGPSGLRAQHLLDSLTPANRATVLELLTEVVQLLADGRGPDELAPFLAGAGLMASEKKDGGVRPIAVGEILRRLVAKILCKEVQEAARQHLWPLQVGVASPLGAECAIHIASQWRERNAAAPDEVFLKVDFSNAFNSVNRAQVLAAVEEHFPELARWCHFCYGRHTVLQFGRWQVSSQRGVQQGDPLGPLLFALAIHPLVKELHSRRRICL